MRTQLLTLIAAAALSACGGNTVKFTPPASNPLNDTGVTQCRTGTETIGQCEHLGAQGQDAQYGRDAQVLKGNLIKLGGGNAGFDFTKIAQNGEKLAIQNQAWQLNGSEAQGTVWHCVQDNHTGLLWEVKSSEETSLHFGADTFSWYEPNAQRNGGQAGGQDLGMCNQKPCDTASFIQRVNQEKLCGKNNWRLPTPGELLSIIDQSQTNPAVDSHYFPNLSFNAHWTAQTHAERTDAAWYVYFTAGDNGVIAKTSVANILVVSGN